MTTFYVDTSSLAKRYLVESGSAWVISWAEPIAANVILIAQLTTVEMFSLLARRQREGTLSAASAAGLQTDFMHHAAREYLVYPLDDGVLKRAQAMVVTHPLRTLDAIQLACALEARHFFAEPMTFVSADNNLLTAAAAEGFAIDNPLSHP